MANRNKLSTRAALEAVERDEHEAAIAQANADYERQVDQEMSLEYGDRYANCQCELCSWQTAERIRLELELGFVPVMLAD